VNILIVSQSRTGSTYLLNMFVNSNIKFKKYPEPFNYEHMESYSQKYIKRIIKTIKRTPNNVCKDHFSNINKRLSDADKTAFLNNNWYIISILRQDLVESTISNLIAEKTNLWQASDTPYLEKFVIDETYFLSTLESRYQSIIDLAEWNHKNKLLNEIVYYEDLKFDYDKDYKNLKLSNTQSMTFKKNNIKKSQPKDSILINYNRLRQIGGEKMLTVLSHPYLNNNNGRIKLK
jgi:hypothetical protein|tara:strand:- start:445 stop:1143 length:699 start_codon:yes stop_codon:yes gene_type:complete